MAPSRGILVLSLSPLPSTLTCARSRCCARHSTVSNDQQRSGYSTFISKTATTPIHDHEQPSGAAKPLAQPVSTPLHPLLAPNPLSSYTQTTPPNLTQLHYANRFFTTKAPSFLFSSTKFRTLPRSSVPEVAFLGRSNVGKSSLLNALLNRTGVKIAHVSSKPGRTRSMNAFGVGGEGGGVKRAKLGVEDGRERERWIGRGGVVILDMPGYGKGSSAEWGKEIVKYLGQRKQLRRVFLLVDASHGPKATDEAFLRLLHQTGIPFQVVLSKADKIVWPKAGKLPTLTSMAANQAVLDEVLRGVRTMIQDLSRTGERAGDLVDVLACSSTRFVPATRGQQGGMLGMDGLRWAVLAAAGLECDEGGRRRVFDVQVVDDDEYI